MGFPSFVVRVFTVSGMRGLYFWICLYLPNCPKLIVRDSLYLESMRLGANIDNSMVTAMQRWISAGRQTRLSDQGIRHAFRYRKLVTGFMATLSELCVDDQGQDIAEYAVILATILVVVLGTIRLVDVNTNDVFSTVASSLQ